MRRKRAQKQRREQTTRGALGFQGGAQRKNSWKTAQSLTIVSPPCGWVSLLQAPYSPDFRDVVPKTLTSSGQESSFGPGRETRRPWGLHWWDGRRHPCISTCLT